MRKARLRHFDVLAKARLPRRQQVAMQAESDGHLRLKTITMRQVQAPCSNEKTEILNLRAVGEKRTKMRSGQAPRGG